MMGVKQGLHTNSAAEMPVRVHTHYDEGKTHNLYYCDELNRTCTLAHFLLTQGDRIRTRESHRSKQHVVAVLPFDDLDTGC